ncbi:unnamed protein product [Bursaphelenchus xylophilus]|uniref:(pine wood nematode) hypothetical protein n=1 Tax=Bursaphelenchus xylophilus TaxID=6326 RepID=A0A1I7SBD2_BURXY|nr:unnamed protein product [Bursaphelenchus xylophilus]CAG9131963.1 unnamed protein product [Bursaphelenchus xylophilus]
MSFLLSFARSFTSLFWSYNDVKNGEIEDDAVPKILDFGAVNDEILISNRLLHKLPQEVRMLILRRLKTFDVLKLYHHNCSDMSWADQRLPPVHRCTTDKTASRAERVYRELVYVSRNTLRSQALPTCNNTLKEMFQTFDRHHKVNIEFTVLFEEPQDKPFYVDSAWSWVTFNGRIRIYNNEKKWAGREEAVLWLRIWAQLFVDRKAVAAYYDKKLNRLYYGEYEGRDGNNIVDIFYSTPGERGRTRVFQVRSHLDARTFMEAADEKFFVVTDLLYEEHAKINYYDMQTGRQCFIWYDAILVDMIQCGDQLLLETEHKMALFQAGEDGIKMVWENLKDCSVRLNETTFAYCTIGVLMFARFDEGMLKVEFGFVNTFDCPKEDLQLLRMADNIFVITGNNGSKNVYLYEIFDGRPRCNLISLMKT